MSHKDVEIIARETCYRGFFTMNKYTVRYRQFNGQWSAAHSTEMVEHPNCVVVLPYDPVQDCVVLIEQFRVGYMHGFDRPWLLETVAGMIESDNPEADVIRELKEETGLNALAIMPALRFLPTPGLTSEQQLLYCAKIDATQVPQYAGLETESEDIKTHIIKTADAFDLVKQGKIHNGPALMALMWLRLNLNEVKEHFSL